MSDRKLVLWIFIALFAVVLLGLSFGCLGLALFTTWARTIEIEQREMSAVMSACAGLLGLGLAGALLVSGVEVWLGRPSPLLYPRRAWILLAVLLGVSAAGGIGVAAAGHWGIVMAPFHVALIVMPALLLFALPLLGGGPLAGVSRRQALLLFTTGVLSTLLAIPVELLGLVFSGVLVAMGAAFIPGGQAELASLALQMEQWAQLTPEALTPDILTTLFASPIVLAVAFLTLAVITPVVEEVLKTALLVGIGFRRRPRPLQAFLWGAAAGIGFAVIEGVFNSAASLTDTASWLAGVGTRIPATAMHAFTSGLVGLGWGYFWSGRKRWLLPLCYVAAILFHGLWNFSVIAVAGTQALLTLPRWLTGTAGVIGTLIVGGLALMALFGVIVVPISLRKRSAAAQ